MRSRNYVLPLGLALLVLLIGWRIVTVNLDQQFALHASQAPSGWHVDSVSSQLAEAARSLPANPAAAIQIAMAAAQRWPGDGRPLAFIALVLEQQGKNADAQALVKTIDAAHPRTPSLQLEIGNFWLRQGKVDNALTHWATALRVQPSLATALFPTMLAIAEDPRNYALVKNSFSRPASWHENFFQYAVRSDAAIDTLKVLYHAAGTRDDSPSAAMRRAYLARLEKEKRWHDAFFVWFNGLTERQAAVLANIHDGGFEVDSPSEGFAWHLSDGKGIRVRPERVTGGSRALHVNFMGMHRSPPVLARQRLLLDPGSYRLTGKIKVDTMAALRGIRWELVCVETPDPPLATTAYFVGKMSWQMHSADFRVPDGCPAQEIRLALHPADAIQRNVSGSVWLDDLKIQPKQADMKS